MRILGLDIGQKRIGVAITDEQCTIAYPLKVLENKPLVKEALQGLVEKYCIDKIVVGMPYNLKGQEGRQAESIREFVDLNLNGINASVVYIDERFSSRISESILREGGKKDKKGSGTQHKRAGGQVDKISASLILSGYMERQKQKSPQ